MHVSKKFDVTGNLEIFFGTKHGLVSFVFPFSLSVLAPVRAQDLWREAAEARGIRRGSRPRQWWAAALLRAGGGAGAKTASGGAARAERRRPSVSLAVGPCARSQEGRAAHQFSGPGGVTCSPRGAHQAAQLGAGLTG